MGRQATCIALRHHISGASFALATLGGHTEFELDFVKAQPCTGMASDFTVGDSAADTDDHGLACWLVNRWVDYKCESISFAIDI
jgi:hypothetical protein